MSREKRLSSTGSRRSETCAISKRWRASIWRTTKWLSLNWRQLSARTFFRQPQHYRTEGIRNETVRAKDHAVPHTRAVPFWRHVVLEEEQYRKAEQRRLLHLHDAPVGAFKGSWKMSYLLDESRAGDEKKRR